MKKIILVITDIGYPFGGAEDYLEDTLAYMSEEYITYWISFSSQSRTPHRRFKYDDHKLEITEGLNEKILTYWIKLFKPSIVHTQGNKIDIIVKTCIKMKIPCLVGFHFWNNIIDLNEATFNKQIIKHKNNHKLNDFFKEIYNNEYVLVYVCSEFMLNVVQEISSLNIMVIHPSSNYSKKCKAHYSQRDTKYITQINIHKLKGGEIFLHLLKKYENLPFQCIQTENMSKDLDDQIFEIMKTRTNCRYLTHVKDISAIYDESKMIIIPSLVDETYCRVLDETLMNGIPVLTSGSGNMRNMLKCQEDLIADTNNFEEWETKLYTILNQPETFSQLSYQLYSNHKSKAEYENAIRTISSRKKNIMFFAPFCDQGLGIQTRNYANILKHNYNIYIFSFRPYNGDVSLLQKNKIEWNIENIHVEYSDNNRENVTDHEITDFVFKHNIEICLLPETCWDRVFEIAKLFIALNVKCYAIPNIEIVRKDEIYKHRFFHHILSNNMLCYTTFQNFGFKNVSYIGYGLANIFKPKEQSNTYNFLCVGGFNAFTRKKVHKVCESVVKAYNFNNNIRLTVTIQGNHSDEILKYCNIPYITIIQEHLSYQDILDLYHKHDVTIHVSSHEGLGIGFYESLATGTPVISLDTQPHNEIIIDNITGWLIPKYYLPMTDNTDSLIHESHFHTDDLCQKIVQLTQNNELKYFDHQKLKDHFDFHLSDKVFEQKFKNCL
jgi:glycosyltransferase involved in cell wall biosynthesis